ncbi:Protein FAR-RED IMPAIRED RESPONSE [Arachis hypogaea]|nr:Protein FAR-RED IMPAIRED RESPONSE [Arachis hypogaea]
MNNGRGHNERCQRLDMHQSRIESETARVRRSRAESRERRAAVCVTEQTKEMQVTGSEWRTAENGAGCQQAAGAHGMVGRAELVESSSHSSPLVKANPSFLQRDRHLWSCHCGCQWRSRSATVRRGQVALCPPSLIVLVVRRACESKGPLNSMAPSHDGFFGTQQSIHGLGGQLEFHPATSFGYSLQIEGCGRLREGGVESMPSF